MLTNEPYWRVLLHFFLNASCFVSKFFLLENKMMIREIRRVCDSTRKHVLNHEAGAESLMVPTCTWTWFPALRLWSCPWAHGIMGCLWDTILVWRAAERPVWPLAFILLLRRRGVASVQAPGPVELRVGQHWGWGGGGWRLGGTQLLPTHAGSVHLLLLHQFGRVDEVPAVEEDHAGRHHARRAPEQHVRQRLRPGVTWDIREPETVTHW